MAWDPVSTVLMTLIAVQSLVARFVTIGAAVPFAKLQRIVHSVLLFAIWLTPIRLANAVRKKQKEIEMKNPKKKSRQEKR